QGERGRSRRASARAPRADRRHHAHVHGRSGEVRDRNSSASRLAARCAAGPRSKRTHARDGGRPNVESGGWPARHHSKPQTGDHRVMSETIGRQTASYRQGLVLGLTMAEIMLLLVFCMLIAVGVALASQRAKLDEAAARLKTVEAAAAADRALVETIKRNARLAELMDRATGAASQREIDEFWRKLVESNDVVASMQRRGVSLAALKEEGDLVAKLQRLRGEGIGPDQ